ncbi:MAG TPA: DUF4388 domain-containing protein, partial [Candidatus Polarisedimenticolia bacterium]|nr:DUF4388 domain-containing protein [Candidatus Polarisedimenticolia bacterium]
MPTHALAGSIGPSDLPEILLSLHTAAKTGLLHVEREGIARDLFLRAGRLILADSSADSDALEWLLFTAGIISEERHQHVRALIGGGERRGRALVESGCLSPGLLCEWTERRVKFLASDVLSWTSGTYIFEEGGAPPPGAITVEMNPVEILLDALRRDLAGNALSTSRPATDSVPRPKALPEATLGRLLQHERYVLSLADGLRRVSEICFLSEIGEAETLRTLAMLSLAGYLEGRTAKSSHAVLPSSQSAADPTGAQRMPGLSGMDPIRLVDLPEGESPGDLRAIVKAYNDHFVYLYGYMIKEVGPIAEQLLDKHLREVREQHSGIFNRTQGNRDGSLPDDIIIRNLNLIKCQNRREALV